MILKFIMKHTGLQIDRNTFVSSNSVKLNYGVKY